MKKRYISALILSICGITSIMAQMVNIGELVVNSGTQISTFENFNNTATGDFINDGTFLVYANFNNDGLVSFSPGTATGLTFFKGASGAQTISGGLLSEFNNVRFENNNVQPAFLVSGDISIMGISDFYRGILDNVNYPGEIVFDGNASHTNTSDNSYVWGHVERRNNNNPFEFPIGDGGYFRPLSTGPINLGNNFLRSKYLLGDSNAVYPHNQKHNLIQIIDAAEYWEFESNQPTVDVALTLSWNENTTPSIITDTNVDTKIAIVRWDTASSKWEFYTTAVDLDNKLATAAVKNDGIFTLARILSTEPLIDDVIVYNGMSPNGDGLNDYFRIDGLENYPDNNLEIYNRWGVKIYETSGYGANNNLFVGYSEGRVTVTKNELLPTGTYFYVLKYGVGRNKVGYLYIN